MRLWHKDLLPVLPRQQLLGQHRECCALRGKGWGKKHATVNYVFEHSIGRLVNYHNLVMKEMGRRGYKVDRLWQYPTYRGKSLGFEHNIIVHCIDYDEHNLDYLIECIENLREKGIIIDYEKIKVVV